MSNEVKNKMTVADEIVLDIKGLTKSFGEMQTFAIPAFAARSNAYAFLLLLITPTISVLVIVPVPTA